MTMSSTSVERNSARLQRYSTRMTPLPRRILWMGESTVAFGSGRGFAMGADMSAEDKLASFAAFDAVAAKDSDLDNGMPWPREGGHSFAQGQGKINDAAGLRKICGGTHRTTVKVPGLTDDNSAST